MKKIVILFWMLLCVEVTVAQKNPCDALVDYKVLNNDIDQMYTFLDTLHFLTLSPFIEKFIEKDGRIQVSLQTSTRMALLKSDSVIQKAFRTRPDSVSCFQYSVNKELHDYTLALTLLARELKNFKGNEESGFRYSQILAIYHHLVASRSALMGIMDATARHFELQESIKLSEKRVKRHVTRWSAATILVVGIACVIQLSNDE